MQLFADYSTFRCVVDSMNVRVLIFIVEKVAMEYTTVSFAVAMMWARLVPGGFKDVFE